MSDAVLKIIADTRQFQAELAKIPGYTEASAAKAATKLAVENNKGAVKAAKALEGVGRAATKAGRDAEVAGKKAGGAFSISVEKIGQALSLASPKVGELSAKIGGLGMAGGPIGIVIGALAAMAGAVYAVGSATLETTRNVEAMADTLSDADRAAMYPVIQRLREQKERLDDAADGWTQLNLIAADLVGGPYNDLLYLVGNIAEAIAESRDEADGYIASLRYLASFTPFGQQLQTLSQMADAWRDVERARSKAQDWRDESGYVPTFDFQAQPKVDESALREQQRRAEDRRKEAQAQQDAWNRSDMDLFLNTVKETEEQKALLEQQARDASRAAADADMEFYLDSIAATAKAEEDAHKATMDRIEAERDARKQAVADNLASFGQLVSTMGAGLEAITSASVAQADADVARRKRAVENQVMLTGEATQAQIDAYKEAQREQKRVLLEQFKARKAVAIAEAAISAAQSVLSALELPPPASFIAAAAAGIAAGVQVGAILSAQPNIAHTGLYGDRTNRQADEQPYLLKRGEVVLDAPRVQAAGGPERVRQMVDNREQSGGTYILRIGSRELRLIAEEVRGMGSTPNAWGSRG